METNTNGNKYFLPGSVILAGVLIGGAVMWSNAHPAGPQQPKAPAAAQEQQGFFAIEPLLDTANLNPNEDPFIGKADAPVTIDFWSDFQCPYCKAFEVGDQPQIPSIPALPQLIKDYVNTGKVKIVFKDFAFLGNDSVTGAEYNRAVWKLYPTKYFEWRTAMYQAQDEEGDQGFGNAESIDKLNATISGLDAAKIAADVQANAAAYQAAATADRTEAATAGVTATPSFVIGKKVIAGAYPYATFQAAIDALLK